MRFTKTRLAMIALCVIWIASAGIYTYNADVEGARSFADWAYRICTSGEKVHANPNLSTCDAQRAKNLADHMAYSTANVAVATLLPLPFICLAAFICMYLTRALILGFRALVPWETLTSRKRLFVVFCALFTCLVFIVGVVAIMNLYTDQSVPVGLSTSLDFDNGGDVVTIAGTWTRTDLKEDTIASPIQTSKIHCDKAQWRCTEALASVTSGFHVLMAEIIDYGVQSWTRDAIVLRREYPCSVEVFTIDLNTKVVSGAGHRINDQWQLCKMESDGKREWALQLTNGFDVYWELRRKARPVPLRVVQAVFGH